MQSHTHHPSTPLPGVAVGFPVLPSRRKRLVLPNHGTRVRKHPGVLPRWPTLDIKETAARQPAHVGIARVRVVEREPFQYSGHLIAREAGKVVREALRIAEVPGQVRARRVAAGEDRIRVPGTVELRDEKRSML